MNEELCAAYQAGDNSALEKLLERNKNFVIRMVSKYLKSYRLRVTAFDDLYQECMLGIMKAATMFDCGRGTKFLTYAAYWMANYMVGWITEMDWIVHVPPTIRRVISKASSYRRENPDASEEDIVAYLRKNGEQVTVKSLRKYFNTARMYAESISLEETDENHDEFAESRMAVPNQRTPEDEIMVQELWHIVDGLPEREREIIKMHMGFYGKKATLEEAGAKYGVSRQRAQMIESDAIKRIRKMLE